MPRTSKAADSQIEKENTKIIYIANKKFCPYARFLFKKSIHVCPKDIWEFVATS